MKNQFIKGALCVFATFLCVGAQAGGKEKIKAVESAQACERSICVSADKKDDLPSIAKPYLGEYECEKALLGGKDLLEKFAYIRLELKSNGEWVARAKGKDGKRAERTGRYAYDEEKEEIAFTFGKQSGFKRQFPLKKGKMEIAFTMRGKSFYMVFSKK